MNGRCKAHNMQRCLFCSPSRNEAWMRAEQERARSNAGTPYRNRKAYTRKRKHKGDDYA